MPFATERLGKQRITQSGANACSSTHKIVSKYIFTWMYPEGSLYLDVNDTLIAQMHVNVISSFTLIYNF